MFVGEGRVGKSALLEAMLCNSFEEDKESTVGMDTRQCNLIIKDVEMAGEQKEDWMEVKEDDAGGCELERAIARRAMQPGEGEGEDDGRGEARATQRRGLRELDSVRLERFLNNDDHGSTMRITAWDFAGQEVFASLHHLYLTPYGVYILVFNMESFKGEDGSNGDNQATALQKLAFWLNSIALHTGSSEFPPPVLLVGTHKDKVPDENTHRRISKLLGERLGYTPGWKQVVEMNGDLVFFPVSNKLGHSDAVLGQLMKQLRKTIGEQEFMKEKLPLTWLQALDEVHNAKHAQYLRLDEMHDLAEKCGLPAAGNLKDECAKLLAFMHDHMFVVWYNEPHLRDLVIRDPAYMIHAASQVIHQLDLHDSEGQKKAKKEKKALYDQLTKKGILDTALLPLLWFDINDEDTRMRLLHILVKFSLAVKLSETTYLVPSMLPDVAEANIRGEEKSVMGGCYFVFAQRSCLPATRSFTAEELKQSGFLPLGLFPRVVGKCVEVSQAASRVAELRLAKRKATLRFGPSAFTLEELLHLNCIRVQFHHKHPLPTALRLRDIIGDVVKDCFHALEFHLLVPFCKDGPRADVGVLPEDELKVVYLSDVHDGKVHVEDEPLSAKQIEDRFPEWQFQKGLLNSYDVMISYRCTKFNEEFALKLFDCFRTRHSSGGSMFNVFLDTERLQTGRRWDEDFMGAITKSKCVVALVAFDALEGMAELNKDSGIDNVLAEWTLAIEMERIGAVERIVPLMMGKVQDDVDTEFVTITDLFNEMKSLALPDEPVTAANKCVADFLRDNGFEPSQKLKANKVTVKHVVESILKFQGVKTWEAGDVLALTGQAGLHQFCVDECVKVLAQAVDSNRQTRGAPRSRVSPGQPAPAPGGPVPVPAPVARGPQFPFDPSTWRGLENITRELGVFITDQSPERFQECVNELNRILELKLHMPGGPRAQGLQFRRRWRGRDVFLSHNWGFQSDGRTNNHDKVVALGRELEAFGWSVWLDEDEMQGDIDHAMRDGIKNCGVFVVCVTKKFLEKISAASRNDNCYIEWTTALAHKGKDKMIVPVAMEVFRWED